MAINWFPGHMNKARKEIAKVMPRMDLVIEILDARIPASSENPLVAELRGDTPSLKVLNKADLADPVVTEAWLHHLEQQRGVRAVALHRGQLDRIKGLVEEGRGLVPEGIHAGRSITAMILGIPNVGKSTLINLLVGRKVAKTSNRPAVTQAQQRVRLAKDFVLIDTPGFLWGKLAPPDRGYRLAATGAIRDAILELEDVAFWTARVLRERYPDLLMERYDMDELPPDAMGVMEAVARRRGALGKRGSLQLHKVSEILINELRSGKIGRITLETPEDWLAEQAEAEAVSP